MSAYTYGLWVLFQIYVKELYKFNEISIWFNKIIWLFFHYLICMVSKSPSCVWFLIGVSLVLQGHISNSLQYYPIYSLSLLPPSSVSLLHTHTHTLTGLQISFFLFLLNPKHYVDWLHGPRLISNTFTSFRKLALIIPIM